MAQRLRAAGLVGFARRAAGMGAGRGAACAFRQPQRHDVGADTFLIADDVVTVLAGPTKPIKLVIEGNPLIVSSAAIQNQDLTQEYLYGEKYGMGIVLAGGNAGIGRYEIA